MCRCCLTQYDQITNAIWYVFMFCAVQQKNIWSGSSSYPRNVIICDISGSNDSMNISFPLVLWCFEVISWNPSWRPAGQRICTICDFSFDGSIIFDIRNWCWSINFGSISNLIVDITVVDSIWSRMWYWYNLISNFRIDHQLDHQFWSSNSICDISLHQIW